MSCIFCKIVSGELPSQRVFENEHVVAFLDIHPCSNGHTLVVPRQHFDDLLATPTDVACELMAVVQQLAPRVIAAVGASAFNTGINTGSASGQAVMHTHVHIIPRFEGDALHMWPEQPTTPDELAATAQKIRDAV